MAPVTVLYRQELPRRAQTLVLQSHHGPGLPLGHTGTSVTLALPHAGQRLCPDRKHTPGVTTGGVPLGLEQRQHRAEAGAGGGWSAILFFLTLSAFSCTWLLLFSSAREPSFGAVLLSVSVPAAGPMMTSTPPGFTGWGWCKRKGKKLVWPRLLPHNDTSLQACP